MPLLVIVLIGILAFGLFDLTLGRPLLVTVVPNAAKEAASTASDSPELPSVREVAVLQAASCEVHDAACQLMTLYRFLRDTVQIESRKPWLHSQQDPSRTLAKKRGNKLDIAILFSSLLDQHHIRNYVIVLPEESYVLACDISPSALNHAGGHWQPATSAFDPDRIAVANDPTAVQPTARIDAYEFQVGDAPCPCLLVDPSAPSNQQPGDPLPLASAAFHSALDLTGQRHPLVSSRLGGEPRNLLSPPSL